MPRNRSRRSSIGREVVPVTPQPACDGLCMDMNCPACWLGLFADVPGDLFEMPPPMRVSAEVDDDTFEAILAEAIRHGVTVDDVVRSILQTWSGRKE